MPSTQGSAVRTAHLNERDRDAVVDVVRAASGDEDAPAAASVTDHRTARRLLADAWSTTLAEMSDVVCRPEETGRAQEIVDLLRRIKELDDSLQRQEVAQRDGVFSRVRDALSSLADVDSTTALLALTPAAVCALGFDRAIVSRISDATWLPENVVVERDESWAAEILAAGQAAAMPLSSSLPESEILRRRVSLIVSDVQQRDAVHKAIADASLSHSYAASPIVCGGQVVGFLHGDCYYHERDLDELDRQVLATFAEGLGQILARTLVLDQIGSVRSGLQDLVGCLGTPQLGTTWTPTPPPGTAPAAVRTSTPALPGRAPSTGAPHGDLTSRELEVLRHMAAGDTNARTARRLVISEGTVKSHVKHILRKLGAANRAEAVSMWWRMQNEQRHQAPARGTSA